MSQDLRALMGRWFEEVWNCRRDETIDELLAPNCVGQMEGAEVSSGEVFKAQRAMLLEAFPDLRLVIEEIAVEGDNAIARWQLLGTHRGSALGVPATGLDVATRGMTWFKFNEGRIVHGWDSWNQGALLQTLQAAAAKLGLPPASTG